MPIPSVGRIAHYVSYGTPVRPDGSQAYTSECRAATITEVGGWITLTETKLAAENQRLLAQEWNPDAVGLEVSNPTGLFFNRGVLYDPGYPETDEPQMCDGLRHDPGTWHWPAKVGE
ncbi:MAG: hypothetical protein ACRDRO_20125 [Pseudonocardiaceae bacterium]